MTWFTTLIQAMLLAFQDLGSTILTFIKDGFTTLFLETTTSDGVTTIVGPSNVAIFLFALMGISLVIGLTTLVFRLMRNKGNI